MDTGENTFEFDGYEIREPQIFNAGQLKIITYILEGYWTLEDLSTVTGLSADTIKAKLYKQRTVPNPERKSEMGIAGILDKRFHEMRKSGPPREIEGLMDVYIALIETAVVIPLYRSVPRS